MVHYTAVIILLGVILMGALVGIAMQGDTRAAEEELAEYQFNALARDAASTGLGAAVYKLADSYPMNSWSAGTYFNATPYRGGTFTVTVTQTPGGPAGDMVDVVARGSHGPGRHVIFARYERRKDDVGIPPAFKNAIVSDFYMQIDGNMLIAAINKTFNASIHTNSDLTVKGNAFLVEGYGTYTGTVNLNNQAESNFMPNINYNGDDPKHHWADSVKIPTIDWERLRDIAQNESGTYVEMGGADGPAYAIDGAVIDFTDPNSSFWSESGLTYTCSSGSCGTEEDPFVLFVNGPADLSNTVQVIGNGYIFATGDVTVSPQGSGGGVYGSLNEKQETQVVLGTLRDMTVGQSGGNACMGLGPATYTSNDGKTRSNNHCQSAEGEFDHGISLYAEGSIEFKGTPFIVGGVVAKNAEFTGGGNPWITYASPNEGTLDAGFQYIVPIGPVLISYSEF